MYVMHMWYVCEIKHLAGSLNRRYALPKRGFFFDTQKCGLKKRTALSKSISVVLPPSKTSKATYTRLF
jgi:hypothetical protein